MKLNSKQGFTLIELMIVVAIIGILAAIAIPQFANMVSKSQEGATKGNLGTLRSSLSIYYGDTEGFYPVDSGMGSLSVQSKYIQAVPTSTLPKTTNSPGHGSVVSVANGAASNDAGGWFYNNTQTATMWGQVLVNCTHNDLKNSIWTSY